MVHTPISSMYFNYVLTIPIQGTKCCNYGADGKKISTTKGGYDCILIPGALKASDSALKSPKICGSQMGLITATGTTNATVCCE